MATTTTANKTQASTLQPQKSNSPGSQKLDELGSFLKTIKAAAAHTALDDLVAIGEENRTLKQDNAANIRQLTRLQVDLDKVERQAKEKDAMLRDAQKEARELSVKLGDASNKLAQTEKKIAQAETEAKRSLEVVQKSLAEEKAEIVRLSKFSLPLDPISERRQEITNKLNLIWTSSLSLAETFFGIDFPSALLITGSEISQWDALKDHRAVRQIPLPLSNSPTAKHMRVAAFLAVLSHEFRKHVFQPTYLLKDSKELNSLLSKLAQTHPEEESYLRSVLLRTTNQWAPGNARAVTSSCLAAVLDSIEGLCGRLMKWHPKRDLFALQLEKHCRAVVEHWGSVQRLEDRVEFDTEAEEANEREWKPLVLKSCPVDILPS
ncbi:hypothetical protein QBC42DRAFT_220328, partial [Cladorrhinum samala]